MTRRTAPASAMFSAAYQQAAVTSRRLLRQPNAAAVIPSAVAALYATCTGYGCSGANKISAESAASALPASIRANGARWPLSAPAASSRRYAVRKFVSSSTSRYTTVLIRPPPLFAAMLPLYAPVGEKIRGRWDVRKADKMNAFPVGEAKPNKNAPLQTTAGREMLFMRFYLDAQAEQLAQEAQSGCSSAQMRSADGVHWSA